MTQTTETPKTYKQVQQERKQEQTATPSGKVICIMGESGSGKTTSMRNLDPASTFYFDCDKKGLSWKGWKTQYNAEKKNYIRTSDADTVMRYMLNISEKAPHIKTVIVDTINGIMIDDEFARMKEKGYDKWQDLAGAVWELVATANGLRDDLTVIFIAHSQTDWDDNGFCFTRLKTSGRKLDKICLESKFTTVLLAKVINGRYVFETKANNSTAKAPMGAFEDDIIDNDIAAVLAALEDF